MQKSFAPSFRATLNRTTQELKLDKLQAKLKELGLLIAPHRNGNAEEHGIIPHSLSLNRTTQELKGLCREWSYAYKASLNRTTQELKSSKRAEVVTPCPSLNRTTQELK